MANSSLEDLSRKLHKHRRRMYSIRWKAPKTYRRMRREEMVLTEKVANMKKRGSHSVYRQASGTILSALGRQASYPRPVSLYSRLQKSSIRILTIEPGRAGDLIKSSLATHQLFATNSSSKTFTYNALSYAWGEEPAIHKIELDGKPFFIRPNLFQALQRMRSKVEPVQFWIDSICINQVDEQERSDQVRHMAYVYANAASVWVWLGEDNSTSKIAFDFISRLTEDDFDWESSWRGSFELLAFEHVLARPWFERRWVIQEAAFSRHTVVFCGGQKIPLRDFSKAVNLVRKRLERKTRIPADSPTAFHDSPATRLLDLIDVVFEDSIADKQPRKRLDLQTLLDLAVFCESGDHRDTIYALLSLANDTPSANTQEEETITPDYSSPLLDVYARFILHCCQKSESLDILVRPWAPDTQSARWAIDGSRQYERNADKKLPSWIATRKKLPFGATPGGSHRLNGKPFVGTRQKPMYRAHAGTKPQVRLGRGDTAACDGSLFVRGVILGSVDETSMRMVGAVISKDCLVYLASKGDIAHRTRRLDHKFIMSMLCGERDKTGEPTDTAYFAYPQETLYKHMNAMNNLDIESLLLEDLPEDTSALLETIRDVVWNRRVFVSTPRRREPLLDHMRDLHWKQQALTGFVPPETRQGDFMCILYGCSVPVVLRQVKKVRGGFYWKLIGDAYIANGMDGYLLADFAAAAGYGAVLRTDENDVPPGTIYTGLELEFEIR